ncbi:hypothetical protein E7Z59_00835 [Robertkochia marina]|uniref:DUF4177 domain-containing protein n=1 Tax=Robertkochia marina TaxID=1227945 RepID=A0A4S3M425_9FLAO|nr:hypothetical protein [Robertkochia marina]THD68907.1 hypothetical protein E7Z59_00835 [Robertkochia marina]TRZ41159.1 hypothetical protein D3A96_14115 [Robertkochia marina]
MKKLILTLFTMAMAFTGYSQNLEYKIITSVESIVPAGLGRSRLISSEEEKNFQDYTSTRTEENNERNHADRDEIRVKNFEETKLLNFYNLAGIRFQNIAANDALVTSKINEMTANGWELAFVTSAVESDSGKEDGNGIFITRYIFKRQLPNHSEN